MASTAAFQPGPRMSVYYASKAYVLSFTEGLAEELRGSGVVASCLAPGPTGTEFAEEAGMERSLLLRLGTTEAARVARVGHRGFRRGCVVVIPGLLNRIGAFLVRLGPRAVVRRTVERLHRER